MNRTKLIIGIICLVIGAGLTVLNLTLPQEELMFMIGDANLPWIPPAVLGILGIVLIVEALIKQEEPKPADQEEEVIEDPEKQVIDKRIETIGWGCFLIMLGGFALVPNETIPKGLWSIGLGVLLIALNLVRLAYKIKMKGFTTFLGVISLVFGITDMLGWTNLHGAILLIVLGANLLLKPWFEERQLFRKNS